jgi:hypothetical protein
MERFMYLRNSINYTFCIMLQNDEMNGTNFPTLVVKWMQIKLWLECLKGINVG